MASHPICLHFVVTSSEYDEELELYTLNPVVKSMNRSDTLLWALKFSSTHEDEADLTGKLKLSLILPWTCPSASCWPDWKYSCKKADAYKITLGWQQLRDISKSKLLKLTHKYKPNKLKNVSTLLVRFWRYSLDEKSGSNKYTLASYIQHFDADS